MVTFLYNIHMKIENIKVFGIIDAIRGMRNPLNSWARNDSTCECDPTDGHILKLDLGENDKKLCSTLVHGGMPHRKFLRQIPITMDITAPTYWWAEMDTYKVGTTRNSCSVQHKGDSRDFTVDDFTFEGHETLSGIDYSEMLVDQELIISILNKWRKRYVDSGKRSYTYFRAMRQFLPMGYNYKATWTGNYETLLNIYEWRKNHKLVEWHTFCDEIKKLPGMDIFLNAM